MSIIKALQDYLESYDGMKLVVLTDRVGENSDSYALFPTGNSKITEDILGNRTYQNSYIFQAKRNASEEFERSENYDLLEAFTVWLEDNLDRGVKPQLGDHIKNFTMAVSNILLMDVDEGFETGTYQIQITVTYTKEVL